MRATGRIVLGGTFDHLHVGHEAMLSTAFRTGRRVAIGLTSAAYLAAHPKPRAGRIQNYAARRTTLARWLRARYPERRWTIVPISDAFGGSVEAGVRALVVSADTVDGGRAVNAERRRLGRRPVPIRVVPLVLADDLRPVSSRRVRSGEIDRNGRRISRIRVEVRAGRRSDRAAAEKALGRAFPHVVVSRTSRRGRVARSRSIRAPELTLTVLDLGGRRRSIALRSAAVALAPETVRVTSAHALTREIERIVRRSSRANRFSLRRR